MASFHGDHDSIPPCSLKFYICYILPLVTFESLTHLFLSTSSQVLSCIQNCLGDTIVACVVIWELSKSASYSSHPHYLSLLFCSLCCTRTECDTLGCQFHTNGRWEPPWSNRLHQTRNVFAAIPSLFLLLHRIYFSTHKIKWDCKGKQSCWNTAVLGGSWTDNTHISKYRF